MTGTAPRLSGPDLALACGVTTLPVSALITSPTGSGKTHLAREAARHALTCGERVIVTVPTKALAHEIARTWADLPGRVQAFTRDQPSPPYRAAHVLIMTPERLDLVTRRWRRHHPWLARMGLLITDEIHTISDPARGAALDAALTRLRATLPLLRILALTATCGNPRVLADWLSALHIGGGIRPMPLTWTAKTVRAVADKPAALQRALTPGESTLVFVHGRQRAADLAAQLQTAGHASAAHHAGLTPNTRAKVEANFRAGHTRVLIATPTLEVGVNLPAEHVVLYDLTTFGPNGRHELTVNAAWQRAGRAGRPGATRAHVTVLGTRAEQPGQYERGRFEPLSSPLARGEHLLGFLLGCVDGGYARTRAQATRMAQQTFAAHTGTLNAPRAVATLLQQGALADHGGVLSVTPLGRVASQALLPVPVVAAVRALPQDPTVLDVLLAAAEHVRLPSLADESRATLVDALMSVPSRTLDAGTAPPDAVIGAALLHATTHHGDDGAAEVSGLHEPTLTALREETLRIVSAWHALSPSISVNLTRVSLAAQLPPRAATLALLSGVGQVTARALSAAGVPDLPTLARTPPAQLTAAGFTLRTAERLIGAAQAYGVVTLTEPAPAPRARTVLADPARLARARLLTVTPTTHGWTVTGGSQARTVTRQGEAFICDCPDGVQLCKHLLAVGLHLA